MSTRCANVVTFHFLFNLSFVRQRICRIEHVERSQRRMMHMIEIFFGLGVLPGLIED
jgi:hypothetical protein